MDMACTNNIQLAAPSQVCSFWGFFAFLLLNIVKITQISYFNHTVLAFLLGYSRKKRLACHVQTLIRHHGSLSWI